VHCAAGPTTPAALSLCRALFNKMTMLTEMLAPARYPEGLISTTAQSWPAAAAGNDAAGSAAGSAQASTIAGVAGLVQLEEPDLQLAATEVGAGALACQQPVTGDLISAFLLQCQGFA